MQRPLGWALAGLFIGILAAWFALAAAGGGHGTYVPAAILFPFTMLISVKVGIISPVLLAGALAQYPIYGFLLAIGRHPRWRWAGLACVHMVFAVAAYFLVKGSEIFG